MSDLLYLSYEPVSVFGLLVLRKLSGKVVTMEDGGRIRFEFESSLVMLERMGHSLEIAKIIDSRRKNIQNFIGTIRCEDYLFTRFTTPISGFVKYKFQCPVGGEAIIDPFAAGRKLCYKGVTLDATARDKLIVSYQELLGDKARFLALVVGVVFLYDMNELSYNS